MKDANGNDREPAQATATTAIPDARAILTLVGEAVYEWTIADDQLRWSDNAPAVLGVSSADLIGTGRGYLALKDPANVTGRHDVIFNGGGVDGGSGVAYEVRYALIPEGAASPRRIIVEDSGRWYADGAGGPARACGVVRVINDRHEREQRLAYLSRYDELTGYFNRQHLLTTLVEALEDAKRSRRNIAFLLVSLDNFAAINEAYGFETGDQVFAAAARRIKAQLREGDAIGRYSGGKLGIVLRNCEEAEMHAAAERFHSAIRTGVISTETSSVAATASIGGVALPRQGTTIGEALQRAQESLQRAQIRGYGRFVAYAPSATREARRRGNAALSSEMVAALDNQRLKLFFQPVVDIETRQPVFCEGLLRLERPEGGFTPAVDFIEICEQLGLIRVVDTFALTRMIDALLEFPSARLSINVSAETVGDGEWLSRLAEAVRLHPGIARRFIAEITESAVIRNLDEVAHFVATIHDLGGAVAIDDFGAGFSSFRHLRSLDVDIVKIDGAFVENLPRSRDDLAFVRALADLARAFEVQIVAEWVQDEETVALLRQVGVHLLQGSLVGLAASELASVKAPGG